MYCFIAGSVIVVWIYLVFMVREKKTNLFHDQMEPSPFCSVEATKVCFIVQ